MSSSEQQDVPVLELPVKEPNEDEGPAKAAYVQGRANPFLASSTKVENRSGVSVVVCQNKRCFNKPNLQSLSVTLQGSLDMVWQQSPAPATPAEPEYQFMLLEDGRDIWLDAASGNTVTIYNDEAPHQYHAFNQPLPGFGKRLVVEGSPMAMSAIAARAS